MHRLHHRLVVSIFLVAGFLPASVVPAQMVSPTPASAGAAPGMTPAQMAMLDALNALQPLLPQVNTVMGSVDVHHWKAPNEVRDTTSADIQSIQRDLNGTLPALLQKAQGMPGSVAPAFAVFRNIDALYDVLLRVTETATLAGSQNEAGRLEQVRADLQARRSQLGTAIQNSAMSQDADVVQLRTSLQAAARAAAQPVTPKKMVVNDGPDAPAAKTTHKRKPSATKPAAAGDGTASQPAPQQ